MSRISEEEIEKEMSSAMDQPFYRSIQSIFAAYYLSLEEGVAAVQADSSNGQAVANIKSKIDASWNVFWQLPEFASITDRDVYLNNVQARLRREGYFLDITPQCGIDTGGLDLATVDNISLRPIMEQNIRKSKVGSQEIEYEEFILGESLIALPSFIEPIVESSSSSEVAIFPVDLQKTLDNDYAIFQDYQEEAGRRFQEGVVSADNLFCVILKLHARQWGASRPGSGAQSLLIQHFRLHAEQHVADFGLLNTGRLAFFLEDPRLTEALNQDSLLEARVLLRQLLCQSLPYYVLEQIINFEREWLDGSRSEYAWAGHILFLGMSSVSGLSDDSTKFWVSGVENLSEDNIRRLAGAFACAERNFKDMLI